MENRKYIGLEDARQGAQGAHRRGGRPLRQVLRITAETPARASAGDCLPALMMAGRREGESV